MSSGEQPTHDVPADLLEEDHELAVPDPPNTYLEDGETVEDAVYIKNTTASGKYKAVEDGQRLCLLTDRRVLLFPGGRPVSFPYQSVSVSERGRLSPYHLTLDDGIEGNMNFAVAVGSGAATYAGDRATLDDVDKIRSIIERQSRQARAREGQLENKRADLDEAMADAAEATDFADELPELQRAYGIAESAIEKARSLYGVDDEAFVTERSKIAARIERLFERRLDDIESTFESEHYRDAVSKVLDTRSRLEKAPIAVESLQSTLDDIEEHQLRSRFRTHVEAQEPDPAARLLRRCLNDRTDGGLSDPVEFFSTQLQEAADIDEAAVRSFVGHLYGELDGFQGAKLARVLDTLYGSNPSLFDAVDPLTAAGLVRDSHRDNRLVACKALQQVGTAQHLEDLRSRRDDDDQAVRVAAMRAMNMIAERENVSLSEADQKRLQSVNIQYHGEGDVITGDYTDASTTVSDSVVNRSDLGGTDREEGSTPNYCPDCGFDLTEYGDPSFCPECGFEM
jgi:hypothetical protein